MDHAGCIKGAVLKATLPAALLTAFSAYAASPELTPVSAADVAQGPDFEVRQNDANLFLATSGDFDGDGKSDEARFFKDERLGVFAAIVTWGDSARPRTSIHADILSNVLRVSVVTLPPGPLRYICYGPVEGCDENGRKIIETSAESVGVVYFGGKQIVHVWNGEAFDAYTVVD